MNPFADPFADRLANAVREKKTPAMVGLDPRWSQLPKEIHAKATARGELDLAAVARGYRAFCEAVIEQVADLVPIVKFQSAFFEAAGPEGMRALRESMILARDAGLLVILDGKRNDIGSTAEAYAEAYLGSGVDDRFEQRAFPCDALTVSPYLGVEGVEPFLSAAKKSGGGVFVLVRTSNPSAEEIQDRRTGETLVHEIVADWVASWSAETRGSSGYGIAGGVVGATAPQQLASLRGRLPHAWLLLPGYGAQGGTAANIASGFDSKGLGAIVNNSRGIIFAYQRNGSEAQDWRKEIRAACQQMIGDLARSTPAGALGK